MRQDLIDLVSNVKYQSVVKNDWFGFVGLFLVYCHSCKRNFAWSMLDDAETGMRHPLWMRHPLPSVCAQSCDASLGSG
jgi:hypothetical protein